MSQPSNHIQQLLIEQAPVAIAMMDTEMRYIIASQKWLEDYGLTDREVIGHSHYELLPEIDEEWKTIHRECLTGKHQKSEENEFIRADGSVQWLSWDVKPWLTEQGEIGGLIMFAEDITQRRKKEKLLQDANEVAHVGGWEIDLIKGLKFWNEITKEILEVEPNFDPNIRNSDFYKDDTDRQKFTHIINEAIAKGTSYEMVLQILTAKGNLRWVRTKGKIEMRNGKCVRLYGTFQNINEKKLQEIRLAASEEKYRSLIENSVNAIFLSKVDGTIEDCNKTAEEMFGYSLEELRKIGRQGIIDHQDEHFLAMLKTRAEQGIMKGEAIAIRKNGTRFPCEISSSVFTDLNGEARVSTFLVDISERKKTEEKLAQSEEEFRNSFEFSAIGMAVVSLEGKWIKVNSSLCEIVGYTEEELLKITFQDITHPDDLVADLEKLQKMLRGELQNYQLEKRYFHKDGHIVWILLAVSLVKDKEGKPVHFVSQIQDITERKIAEKALKERDQQLSSIYNAIAYEIFVLDIKPKEHYHYAFVNKSFLATIGITSDQIISKDVRTILSEPVLSNSLAKYKKAIQNKTTVIWQENYRHSNGRIAEEISITPVFDEEGNCMQLVGVMQDLTYRIQAEQQIKQNEQKFRTLFELSPVAFAMNDYRSGEFLDFNNALLKDMGYTREEFKKLDYWEITPIKYEAEERRWLAQMKETGYFGPYEKELIKKDGTLYPILMNGVKIVDAKGWEVTWSVIENITDIKEKEKELRSLVDVTSEQNKRLLNFAHIVSHNLRSHSVNFGMLLGFLETETEEDQKAKIISMLNNASNQLTETVANLNEVVAVNTNIHERKEPLNLRKKIEDARESIGALIQEENVQVINQIPEDLTIQAVPAYMESVLLNFLTNAIKYRSPSRNVVVKFSTQCEDNFVVLYIEDNGLGIDLEKHGHKLFGMYKTFHGNKDARGIGLFITKNQVEAMGGKIEVESTVGKGTTFKIYLSEEN